MAQIYDPAFCGAMLKFFSVCYRKGLVDASQCGDEIQCVEIAERLKHPAEFVTLTLTDLEWLEYQFVVLRWTRESSCRSRLMDLLLAVRTPKHPKAFILQIAKMFYRGGLLDWMACKDWLTADVAKQLPSFPYLLKIKRSYRISTRAERFEQLQHMILNMLKIQEMFDFTKPDMADYRIPKIRIVKFVERLWASLQKVKWFDSDDDDDND